jgi:hypothetical protein
MTSAAAKVKRYRERLAAGRVVLSIEVNFNEWSACLLDAGFITENEIDSRVAVTLATERIINLLIVTGNVRETAERQ